MKKIILFLLFAIGFINIPMNAGKKGSATQEYVYLFWKENKQILKGYTDRKIQAVNTINKLQAEGRGLKGQFDTAMKNDNFEKASKINEHMKEIVKEIKAEEEWLTAIPMILK